MAEIVSLFDYYGLTLDPWAEAGYKCFAYDLKHKTIKIDRGIVFSPWDARDDGQLKSLIEQHQNAHMVMGFPPCTDLAISGTRHWAGKAMIDPDFQKKAMDFVRLIPYIANVTNSYIWWLENPVGAIPRFWRDADFWFDPFEYGGYLDPSDQHPLWPNHIPSRDAYPKRTGIWCNHNFLMPPPIPVKPLKTKDNWSPQQNELGGKSEKTKEIRSATPRGFARAVFIYNQLRPLEESQPLPPSDDPPQ